MAITITPKLRGFQFKSAFLTAPQGMSKLKIAARMASTLFDGKYGSLEFDSIIFGDDPLVTLCLAVNQIKANKRVLIAPDSLTKEHWPTDEWSNQMHANQADFESPIGIVLGGNLGLKSPICSLKGALSHLLHLCEASKKVSIIAGDYLQSSEGIVKGCKTHKIFFPLQAGTAHEPSLNPLWKLALKQLPNVCFSRKEIEFVSAITVFYTTPVSPYVDPAIGLPIGNAIQNLNPNTERLRVDEVRSALNYQG